MDNKHAWHYRGYQLRQVWRLIEYVGHGALVYLIGNFGANRNAGPFVDVACGEISVPFKEHAPLNKLDFTCSNGNLRESESLVSIWRKAYFLTRWFQYSCLSYLVYGFSLNVEEVTITS